MVGLFQEAETIAFFRNSQTNHFIGKSANSESWWLHSDQLMVSLHWFAIFISYRSMMRSFFQGKNLHRMSHGISHTKAQKCWDQSSPKLDMLQLGLAFFFGHGPPLHFEIPPMCPRRWGCTWKLKALFRDDGFTSFCFPSFCFLHFHLFCHVLESRP